MSEAAEAPKKKKPIIPIAMILIVLLGGGFFMMKSKSGGSKAEAAIVASDKETELDEFLTNTQNQTFYVRAKIAVRLRKDFEETKLKDNAGDVRDAVILVFNNTPPADVTDPLKRKGLKKMLADAMNKALAAAVPPEGDGSKPKKKHHAHKSDDDVDDADVNPDWDSQTGPVLKVRFLSLATQ